MFAEKEQEVCFLPRSLSTAHIARMRQNSDLTWKLLTNIRGLRMAPASVKYTSGQNCLPSSWALIGEVIPLLYKSRPTVGVGVVSFSIILG